MGAAAYEPLCCDVASLIRHIWYRRTAAKRFMITLHDILKRVQTRTRDLCIIEIRYIRDSREKPSSDGFAWVAFSGLAYSCEGLWCGCGLVQKLHVSTCNVERYVCDVILPRKR